MEKIFGQNLFRRPANFPPGLARIPLIGEVPLLLSISLYSRCHHPRVQAQPKAGQEIPKGKKSLHDPTVSKKNDNDTFFCSNKGQVCTELLEFCPIPLNFSCMVCLLGTHLQSQLLIFLWLRSYLTGRLIFKQQDQTFSTQGVEHNESYFSVQGRLVW